jgi:hypothetical protein
VNNRLTRRRFLTLSSAGITGTVCSGSSIFVLQRPLPGFAQQPPRFDRAAIGLATTYELIDKPEQRARTLRALEHIVNQRFAVDAGNKTVVQAADEIRRAVETERGFDPQTFGQVAKLLEGQPVDTVLLRSAVAGGLGAAGGILTTAEVVSGPPGWAVAGALGVFTLIADSLITNMSSVLPIRRMDDQAVFGLTAWAMTKFSELSESSPTVMNLAAGLNRSGHLAFDPRRSLRDSADSLPPGARKLIEPHLSASHPTLSAGDIEKVVRTSIMEGFGKLDKRLDDAFASWKRERNEAIRAAREAAVRREVEYNAAELNGVGILGNFLLTHVGGNPQEGQRLQKFIQAGVGAYMAIAMPGIGPLAMAGQLAASASTIAGLFGPADPLSRGLGPISAKLDLILEQLRLLTEQQVAILRTLEQVYKAINVNRAILEALQNQLSALGKDTVEGDIGAERIAYLDRRNELASQIANNSPAQIAGDLGLKQTYSARVSNCVTYAVETAATANHAGTVSVPRGEAEWAEAVQKRGRCDRIVGILLDIAGRLGVRLPTIPGQAFSNPVNPTAWAEGVNAFITARSMAPSVSLADDTAHAQRLWLQGQYVREMIRKLTTVDVLIAAERALLDAAGVPKEADPWSEASLKDASSIVGEVYRSALTYDTKNVQREIVGIHVPNTGRYYVRSGGGFAVQMEFRPDYFKMAEDAKLISEVECQKEPTFRRCHYKIMNGQRSGSFLTSEKVGILSDSKIMYPFSMSTGAKQFRPWTLQQRAQELLLEHKTRPSVQKDLPAAIRSDLKAKTTAFPAFSYWGEAVRVLGTFVRWRLATLETPDTLLLKNCPGPFSIPELSVYLETYIAKRLSPAGNWPFEVAQTVQTTIQEAVEPLKAAAAVVPPDKGVPTVDETLRRLAAFMIARGVTLTPLSHA